MSVPSVVMDGLVGVEPEVSNMKDTCNTDAVGKDALKALPSQSIDAWDVLKSLIGQVEGPEDWSEQYGHYLYGTPKK